MNWLIGVLLSVCALGCGGGGGNRLGVSTCTWNAASTSSGFCDITLTCQGALWAVSCGVDKGDCICEEGIMQTKGNSFSSPGICKATPAEQAKAFEANCLPTPADMAMGAGSDGAMNPNPDFAMQSMPDLTMTSRPNLKMGGTLGCKGALACVNNCMDDQCLLDCQAMSKANGWTLLQTLIGCIFGGPNGNPKGACPNTNGGVCDGTAGNFNQTNCDNCVAKSQAQGGACSGSLNNCLNDLP